jgi:cell division protein YceG involved in septum cleavage
VSRGDRSQSGRERTAEERERDRLERERKRAQAVGRKSPPPPVPIAPSEPADVAPTPLPPIEPVEPAPGSLPSVEHAEPISAPPSVEPVELAPVAPVEPADAFPPAPPAPGETEPPAAAAPPTGSVHLHPPRSVWARVAATIALAAVVVAVVLLLHSHDDKHVATVATAPVVKVLIPEGKTRPQIAQIAAAGGLKGSYRAASRRSPLLHPEHYGAPRTTPDLEGFLFPATYDMDPGAPVSRLVQEQLIAFRENFGASEFARARDLHVTPYQLLIVASMVEREAQVPDDRAKIAAVIYNRLREGMPLGIDATIYYAVELERGIATYTHELSEAQLHIDSPYNTRTHTGLPPTPISNPGAASIQAAAHPAHVSYLYYVAGADGCGEQVFSNTLAEFEVHDAAYKAAVAKNGGHPPTCKHER